MDNTEDNTRLEYLLSLPKEEAAAALRGEGVGIMVRTYQRAGIIAPLSMLAYGSDAVFAGFAQSLGDNFLKACLKQPESTRSSAADAITHMLHFEHTDMNRVAILLSKLEPKHLTDAAEHYNVTTGEVQTALVNGLIVLLGAENNHLRLQMMALALMHVSVVAKSLPETAQEPLLVLSLAAMLKTLQQREHN